MNDLPFQRQNKSPSYVSLGDLYNGSKYTSLVKKDLVEETNILYSIPLSYQNCDDWYILIINNEFNTFILHNKMSKVLSKVYKLKEYNSQYDSLYKCNNILSCLTSLLYFIPSNYSLDLSTNISKEIEIEKDNNDKFVDLKQLYSLLHNDYKNYYYHNKRELKVINFNNNNKNRNSKLIHSTECIDVIYENVRCYVYGEESDKKLISELYSTIQYFLFKEKMFNRKEFIESIQINCCGVKLINNNEECEIDENVDGYKEEELFRWNEWKYEYDKCIMKYDFITMKGIEVINKMLKNDKEIMKEIIDKKLLYQLFIRIYCLSRLNQTIVSACSNCNNNNSSNGNSDSSNNNNSDIINISKIPYIEDIKYYLTVSTIQSIMMNYYICLPKLSIVSIMLNESLKVKDYSCNCIYHQFLNNIWNIPISKKSSLSHSLSIYNQSYQQISLNYLLFVAMNHRYLFTNRSGKYMVNINGKSIYLEKDYYGIGVLIGLIIESVDFEIFKYFPVYFWKLLFNECLSVEDVDLDILTNSMNENNTGIFKEYTNQLISNNDFDSYHFCYNVSMKYVRKGMLDVIPYDIYKLLSYRFIKSLQNM